MSIKVIGAGFGRTGTNSLKMALETLGFKPCYHMFEVQQQHVPYWYDALEGKDIDWKNILKGFQAAVDWPVAAFVPELMQAYPDAKIILSERNPESWFQSASETIFEAMSLGAEKGIEPICFAKKLIIDGIFDGRYQDKDYCISKYKQHIDNIIALVPSEKLLRHKAADGWKPLCDFLEVDVPMQDYPRSNDKETFQGLIKALRA